MVGVSDLIQSVEVSDLVWMVGVSGQVWEVEVSDLVWVVGVSDLFQSVEVSDLVWVVGVSGQVLAALVEALWIYDLTFYASAGSQLKMSPIDMREIF